MVIRIMSECSPTRLASPDCGRRAGPRLAAFRLRQAAHAARRPVSNSTMNEMPAMITKMMNATRSQPWNGCLSVAAMSAASAALAAVTPANHAATFPPQSTTDPGYPRHLIPWSGRHSER